LATETELKLAVRAGDLPALRRALRAMAGNRPARRSNLVSTYYETEDRAVARSGLVLRVRQQDGRFVQTIKSRQAAGAPFTRGEWEDLVADDRPDPDAPESGGLLPAGVAERLAPMFRTVVQRDSIELSPRPGTRIDAAVDRGEIRACRRPEVEPISEIELELKAGNAAALYDVALELLATSPVRIHRSSKAERGYALADPGQAAPPVVRAPAIDLDPELSAEESLRRIGCACLDQMLGNEAAALAGRPDAVHQMRVAIRRLRAALSGFRKMLPGGERRWASAELRWLADALGEVRNLDVLGSAILDPARQAGAVADANLIAVFAAAVERRRRTAHAGARRAIRSRRYAELTLRLYRWFDGGGWRQAGGAAALQRPIGEIAPALLADRERGVRRRRQHFKRQTAAERHKLRIALKKLRYAAELFGGLFPARKTAKYIQRLKRLQDGLGDENDVHLAAALLPKLLPKTAAAPHELAAAGERIVAWHQHRLSEKRPSVRADLRSLRRAKPFWRA
jgi:triphosphatase